jgi:hypothetical protein
MTTPDGGATEEHLTAEEDDGSAELQPEDGGTATTPGSGDDTAR